MAVEVSIIVPAFNEANVIADALRPLADAAAEARTQVIVVPNNCSDQTASVALTACADAQVIETDIPGKANALNIAVQHAVGEVLVFLDADLKTSMETIQALVTPIASGKAEAACGKMVIETSSSSFLVRKFYQGWLLNPYFDAGKFGGLFAVSAFASHRIFPMPQLVADDEWICRQFRAEVIAFVPEAEFLVFAPRRFSDLINIRKRSLRGTRELDLVPTNISRPTGTAAFRKVIKRVIKRPSRLLGVLVYAFVVTYVRLLVALERPQAQARWERDESSRTASLRQSPS